MVSEALRLFGTEEPVAPVRVLRAGPLTLGLQHGQLRRICCGEHELWHGLAFVLRDADWGTPEATLGDLQVQEHAGGATFDMQVQGRFELGLAFSLRASGRADGSLHFEVQAVAERDVMVNRLGLCLQHPLSACGARVQVRHVDGRSSVSTFPTLIPPWPPFMGVRALRHEWASGCWADAELLGDSFELEDERNNGDASFKTYSRSNMAPRPYCWSAGSVLRQSALLRVEGPALDPPAPSARTPRLQPHASASASASASTSTSASTSASKSKFTAAEQPSTALTLSVGPSAGALPAFGVEITAADADVPALHQVLRELQPAHLHLAWQPGQAVNWSGVALMLAAAGAVLRLDVQLTEPGVLPLLRQALDAAGITPEAVAVFPSTPVHVAAARAAFAGDRSQSRSPSLIHTNTHTHPVANTLIGGGTPHFFVQLSRLDELGDVDFASFTTSALVHGAHDDDVMQGLASLPAMVATWRARHPALPLRMGPNGIAARASPLGAQPASDGTRRLALAAVDPRSRAQFGAAWALGHAAALAGTGVQAVTLLALTGASGLVAVRGGHLVRHPAFDVLQALGRPADGLQCSVSDAQRVAALAFSRQGHRQGHPQVLLANLTPEPQSVRLAGEPAAQIRLGPYEVRRQR